METDDYNDRDDGEEMILGVPKSTEENHRDCNNNENDCNNIERDKVS